jgi:hypothetical protein
VQTAKTTQISHKCLKSVKIVFEHQDMNDEQSNLNKSIDLHLLLFDDRNGIDLHVHPIDAGTNYGQS